MEINMANDIGSIEGSVSADAGGNIGAGVGSGGSDSSMSFANDVAAAITLEMERQPGITFADAIVQATADAQASMGTPGAFVAEVALYDAWGGYVGMGTPPQQDYYAMMGINTGSGGGSG
jgi:hypothetical protein